MKLHPYILIWLKNKGMVNHFNKTPVAMGRRLFLKNTSMVLAASALVPLYASAGKSNQLSFAILSDLHFHWKQQAQFNQYIQLINQLKVDFVVLNGDNINDDGFNLVNGVRSWELFGENYNKFYDNYLGNLQKGIKVFPVMGNHDPFFPGQRNPETMGELMKDEKFLFHHRELVSKCTGNDKEFYSWDLADWHFLTIPCGGNVYFENIGVFDWLEQELKANKDKPTIVYMHVPPLGIGMTDAYFINLSQKGRLMELFTRYGNVKYVFSGHIHNSTKVSVRSAREYKGTKFVVCPTHIWDQRPFGANQKYADEIKQKNHGFIVGYLQNGEAELFSVLPDSMKLDYPQKVEKYTIDSNPINFYPLAKLPPVNEKLNLFDDQHWAGWYSNYVYNEEQNPSYIREKSKKFAKNGNSSMYLSLKGRTNVYADFQNISQVNSVFRYFEKAGNTRNCKLSLSYLVEKMQWAETDLTKHPNPDGEVLKPGRFRYPEFFNQGFITIGFVKDQKPVYELEILFGKREKANTAQQRRPADEPRYIYSVFDYGEWQHPANKKTISHDIMLQQWVDVSIDFGKELPEGLDFDRILVSLNLANDGLMGHEMAVYFNDIAIQV
jgi:predicted MPP superfamily phosphohydrolase